MPFIPMMRPNSTRKGPLSLQPTDIAILGNALSASTVRKPMALNGQRVTDLFEPTLSDHNNRCLSSADVPLRSEEHTSELQSLMRISYAVFCLKNKQNKIHLQ